MNNTGDSSRFDGSLEPSHHESTESVSRLIMSACAVMA